MKIIKAELDDWDIWKDSVIFLHREAIKSSFKNNMPEDSYFIECLDKIRRYVEEDNATVFLCVEDASVVGMAWCHPIQRFKERRLHIASIAVMPQSRGSGIGKKLLKEIENYARDNKYVGIDLLVTANNLNAVALYENNGFKTERVLMKKDL